MMKYGLLICVVILGACGPTSGGTDLSSEERQCRTLAFLAGLGAMASSESAFAGTAMLQGAGTGANSYGECGT